jgi:hypothetical protein
VVLPLPWFLAPGVYSFSRTRARTRSRPPPPPAQAPPTPPGPPARRRAPPSPTPDAGASTRRRCVPPSGSSSPSLRSGGDRPWVTGATQPGRAGDTPRAARRPPLRLGMPGRVRGRIPPAGRRSTPTGRPSSVRTAGSVGRDRLPARARPVTTPSPVGSR